MNIVELVTIGIALWGAVLSTILAIREIFKDRRNVNVSYNLAITSNHVGNPITLIGVEAINKGHRPITIAGGGLLLSDGRTYVQPYNKDMPTKLPARLEDGESISLYLDLNKVQENGKELAQQGVQFIGAFVRDAEGKKHIVRISRKEGDFLASSPRNS